MKKKQELENVFVIEKNVEIPKRTGTRPANPYITKFGDQLMKMLPKDRIRLPKSLLGRVSVSEPSIRGMIVTNENLRGRFTIRNIKNMDKEIVETNICCIA